MSNEILFRFLNLEFQKSSYITSWNFATGNKLRATDYFKHCRGNLQEHIQSNENT